MKWIPRQLTILGPIRYSSLRQFAFFIEGGIQSGCLTGEPCEEGKCSGNEGNPAQELLPGDGLSHYLGRPRSRYTSHSLHPHPSRPPYPVLLLIPLGRATGPHPSMRGIQFFILNLFLLHFLSRAITRHFECLLLELRRRARLVDIQSQGWAPPPRGALLTLSLI